jgi:hypothetical protein
MRLVALASAAGGLGLGGQGDDCLAAACWHSASANARLSSRKMGSPTCLPIRQAANLGFHFAMELSHRKRVLIWQTASLSLAGLGASPHLGPCLLSAS